MAAMLATTYVAVAGSEGIQGSAIYRMRLSTVIGETAFWVRDHTLFIIGFAHQL
jgi:hypothetical protein